MLRTIKIKVVFPDDMPMEERRIVQIMIDLIVIKDMSLPWS